MNDSLLRYYHFAVFYTVFYSLVRLTAMPDTYAIVRIVTDGGMFFCSFYFVIVWLLYSDVRIVERIIGVCMVLIACMLLVSFHYRILLELTFLLSTRIGFSYDDILKKIIKYSLITFAIVYLTSLLGITSNTAFLRDDMYEVDTLFTAHSFGFYYYSAPAYLFMNVIVGLLYLSKGQCSRRNFILLVLLSFLVFALFTTRLQLIVNIVMFIAYLVIYNTNGYYFEGRVAKYFSLLAYPLMALCVFIVFSEAGFIDEDMLILLNLIFNGRLHFNQEAFEKFDVLWGGNLVETSTGTLLEDYFFIDCGYIDILIRYGYIMTSFILVVFSIVFYKIYQAKEKFLYIYMMLFVFTSFVNNFFFAASFFSLPLLYGCTFATKENEELYV